MKRPWVSFIIGFVIGVLVLPVCAYFYIRMGAMPVETAGPSLPLEKWAAHTSLEATLSRNAPHDAKYPPTEENLVAGAKVYLENCAVCHGTLYRPKTAIAKGMYPKPPQFFSGNGVADDPVGFTYWKVDHGIRLTGMPAFGNSLSDLQIWQVSQMLAHADNLPTAAEQVLKESAPAK